MNNFSNLQPLEHNHNHHRLSRPSILRRTSRKDSESVYEDSSEYNQKQLQWDDGGSPDQHSTKHREIPTVDGRRSKQSQISRSRSLSGTRGGLYSGSDYLPYFRSKSVHNLDTESTMSQFRPATNHKAVIDHTYNIERSRSKSRDGFVRKRVVTTPLAMREDHRERTLYTDRYRGLKDVYTESNTEHVEKQFYKKLADVKMEEFRSVSRSTDKNSKQRKRVLLKQIQDLRKMNTRYGRAVEKRYKSKFSVYHPTDTAARFKNTTGVQVKGKYAHDFSKWRQKEQEVRSDERNENKDVTNNNRTYVKKGRSYKGPSWEKEGLSYMQRLEKQEPNEDASSGDNTTMREMLKEAENLLNVVEHNFPGAMEGTIQKAGKPSPIKTRSPTHNHHSGPRSRNIDKTTRSKPRSQSFDGIIHSRSRSKTIDETIRSRSHGVAMSPDYLNSGYTKADIKTRLQNINLTGSAREGSNKKLGLPRLRSNKQVTSDSLPEYKPNGSIRFERSRTLNTSSCNSKQLGELRKQVSNPGITRTTSDIHRRIRIPNFRLPKLPTDGGVEQIRTLSNSVSDYKDMKAKHQSGLYDKRIIIPAPPLPAKHSQKSKSDETTTKLPPVCTNRDMPETEKAKDKKLKINKDDEPEPVVIKAQEQDVSNRNPYTPLPKEEQQIPSRLTVRIDAPKDQASEPAYDSRITPAELLRLSRQSFRKTPISKPSSREKLTATKDRILITPISLKNKGPALLVANYRIITPVANESLDPAKEQTQYENADFFLTFVDPGDQKANFQVQKVETVQSSEVITTIEDTREEKYGKENSLQKENTEDALCLDKWKALVQHYLTEVESET